MSGHHNLDGGSILGGILMVFTDVFVLGNTYVDTFIKGALGGIAGFLAKELLMIGYKQLKQYIKNKKNNQNQKP
jgi:hypothetical protein